MSDQTYQSPFGPSGFGPGLLEPGVVGRGVVHDEVDDHPHPALVRRLDEGAEVLDGAVVRVDVVEVGDVVAAVLERRGVERKQPDAVDPEPLQVVELLHQAAKVARAVVVPVEERAGVDLVEDRGLEPQRIALEPVPGLAHAPIFITCDCPGAEANVVAADPPAVALAGQQVAHRELLRQADVRRDDDDVLARHTRIEIDGDRDLRALRVREHVLAVRPEQAQVLEALQRRLGAADLVQPLHERQQRPVELALLDLVLLRVEVLLAPRRHRHVLEVLVAGVDPVRGRERRGQHEPRLERRRATLLEVLVEDVRRVDEEVRPVERRPPEQHLQELRELRLRVLPREVGVRLAEADLRERRHHRRPREGLGEEDRVGKLVAHLADQPLPEGHRLRVRVVDAEGPHAVAAPVEDDVPQRLPQTGPVLASRS